MTCPRGGQACHPGAGFLVHLRRAFALSVFANMKQRTVSCFRHVTGKAVARVQTGRVYVLAPLQHLATLSATAEDTLTTSRVRPSIRRAISLPRPRRSVTTSASATVKAEIKKPAVRGQCFGTRRRTPTRPAALPSGQTCRPRSLRQAVLAVEKIVTTGRIAPSVRLCPAAVCIAAMTARRAPA